MEKYINTVIVGSGSYLAGKVVKNNDFMNAEFYDTDNERIPRSNEEIIEKFREIVGIDERRYAEDHITNSDMATAAAQQAIDEWGGDKNTLDYVIVAHNYGDMVQGVHAVETVPNMACRVKHKLGIANNKCVPYDMIFGCPGWVQGVILGHQFIQAGLAKNVLVIGSDTLSRAYDPHDRDSMIFADGAGAVVLSAIEDTKKYGVLSTAVQSDNGDEIEYLKGGPSLNPDYKGPRPSMIRMAGRKVYEYVLKNVPAAIKEAMDKAGVGLQDTEKMLIHQANEKMDEAVFLRLKRLYRGCTHESKDYMPLTLSFLGNSSVATVPTLYDLVSKGKLGDHHFTAGGNIIMASVGAGMNINALVYRFPEEK